MVDELFLYGVVVCVLKKLESVDVNFSNASDAEVALIPQWWDMLMDLAITLEKGKTLPEFRQNEFLEYLYEAKDLLDENQIWDVKHPMASISNIISPARGQASDNNEIHDLRDPLYSSLSPLMDEALAHSPGTESPMFSPTKIPIQLSEEDSSPNNIELPPHLIPCFAYCSLYPQGHRLVREILVNQWMAEGFLLPLSDYEQELEEIGDRYFNELLSRGLFQYPIFSNFEAGVVHSCEMHPLAHATALRIASNVAASLPYPDHSSAVPTQGFWYVAFDRHRLFRDEFKKVYSRDRDRVRTCLFLGSTGPLDLSFLHSIALKFYSLRVLDLSNSQFKKLPDFGWSMTDTLRYLSLSRNFLIEKLEFELDRLNRLQTLAVDGCLQLEKLSLNRMCTRSLRHLYLTSHQKTLDLHSLSFLRILELSHCTELSTLSSFGLTSLMRLRISNCPRLVSVNDMHLNWIEELVFHNCASLDLAKCSAMNQLPRLRYLEVVGQPKLSELPLGLKSATSLQYFLIANCKRLRELTYVLGHLLSLEKLCVYNCPTLSAHPQGIRYLKNIRSLHIRNCPKLVTICQPDREIALDERQYCLKDAETITDEQECLQDLEIVLDEGQYCVQDPKTVSDEQKCLPDQRPLGSNLRVRFVSPKPFASVPYFIMKSQAHEYSPDEAIQGIIKISSRWAMLALTVRAIARMKAMVLKTNERLAELNLYCCLFPTDYEFERDTLIQLWMAADFIKENPMEDSGDNLFNILLSKHHISEARVDLLTGQSKYRVDHDKITTAISFGRPTTIEKMGSNMDSNTLLGEVEATDTSAKSWHVSLVANHIDQTTLDTLKRYNELKTLGFICNYESSLKTVPSELFSTLSSLRALDLSGSHITELPSSIANMRQLRYLDLSSTPIKELPESIDCLQELQTLKLRGCEHLFELPKELTKLINLRHLDFDILGQLTCMPRGMGRLTELRTLSAFIVNCTEDGCDIKELETMNNLSGSFCISGLENVSWPDIKEAALCKKHGLTRLELRWNNIKLNSDQPSDSWHTLLHFEPSSCLEELQILRYPGSRLPWWIVSEEFWKLTRITLFRCEIEELISLGWLPNLKYLDITQMDRVTMINFRFHGMRGTPFPGLRGTPFPSLKELVIDGMSSLTEWIEVRSGYFPLLSELIIKDCPKLIAVSFLPLLPSLEHIEISHCTLLECLADQRLSNSMKTLLIDDCPSLKQRCWKGGEDWPNIEHVPEILIDLEDMHLTQENDTKDNDSLTDSLSEDDLHYYEDLNHQGDEVAEVEDQEREELQ